MLICEHEVESENMADDDNNENEKNDVSGTRRKRKGNLSINIKSTLCNNLVDVYLKEDDYFT